MDSYEAIIGRVKIFDNVKSYKYEGHMKTCYEHDSMPKQYDTNTLLHAVFTKTFNASTFLHVWNYMDQYVDVDGSSELGKYFMKNIYVNLAMEVKRYLNVLESRGPEADARKKLLAFYDCIPIANIFKDVDKSDFKELENRSRGQRRKMKQPDTSGLTRFMS
ncbi:hypothetical protein LPUS_10111 [Lasallia pustulata]|uniref:Uncharacterized protein n=1 Tax=Lasallia pustulata TaxID=136370 RepID=A0A1W5D9C9_9LECA|nr:hypothetical protein LPUS_10111 [Lasallia pustulata]